MAVGYQVFQQRNQLRNLTFSNQGVDGMAGGSRELRDSDEKPPNIPLPQFDSHRNLTNTCQYDGNAAMHTRGCYVTAITEVRVTTESHNSRHTSVSSSSKSCLQSPDPVHRGISYQRAWSENNEYKQTKLVGSGNPSQFQSICTSNAQQPKSSIAASIQSATARCIVKFRHLDPVKLAYLRTSFVFAISVLVTWTPSSINRVYSLRYPERISFSLNVASALVLPLQGLWNAIIYFSTSWKALKDELSAAKASRSSRWVRRRTPNARVESLRLASRFRSTSGSLTYTRPILEEELGSAASSGKQFGTVRVLRGSF
jgi:hypothetical protein